MIFFGFFPLDTNVAIPHFFLLFLGAGMVFKDGVLFSREDLGLGQ